MIGRKAFTMLGISIHQSTKNVKSLAKTSIFGETRKKRERRNTKYPSEGLMEKRFSC